MPLNSVDLPFGPTTNQRTGFDRTVEMMYGGCR
jgi:hypothetical protein